MHSSGDHEIYGVDLVLSIWLYNHPMGRPVILSGINCYHCGSDQTSKGGRGKYRRQRYKCRTCKRFFTEGAIYPPPGKYRISENTPTADQLILELQIIAQRIGKTPTTTIVSELAREGDAHHPHHYYAVFGSFREAQRRSKLRLVYRQEFDPADRLVLLNQLRDLSRKLGRPLFADDVVDARKRGEVSPLNHFFTAFDTIPSAIELAGVAPKRQYTREELIEHLQKVDSNSDRPVTGNDLDALYDIGKGPSHRQYDRMFGSLANAREEAKVKNEYATALKADKYWKRYTVEEVIIQLQTLQKQLGRKPTFLDINNASGDFTYACADTVARMFGSLPNAYRAAGFEKVKPKEYTDAELIESLRSLTMEFGRFPLYKELLAMSLLGRSPSPGTIGRRLGRLRDIKTMFDTDIVEKT